MAKFLIQESRTVEVVRLVEADNIGVVGTGGGREIARQEYFTDKPEVINVTEIGKRQEAEWNLMTMVFNEPKRP